MIALQHPTPEPTLERCELAVQFAEHRLRRASAKLDAARLEHVAALIGACHAKAERAHFIANCPDDEPVML